MEDEEQKFSDLLDKIVAFNTYIIERYAGMNVDIMTYAEDLGMQVGPSAVSGKF